MSRPPAEPAQATAIEDLVIYRVAWTCIHLAARALDVQRTPEQALGFVCFMQGLRDLFPLQLVRSTLAEFMQVHPLKSGSATLADNTAAFRWTYDLHNYASYVRAKRCGRPPVLNPPMQACFEQFGPEKYGDNSWGMYFWTLWHYVAANLPAQMTHPQYVQYVAFVQGLQLCLPCSICRQHMRDFLAKHQLASKPAFYRVGRNNWDFSVALHNEVNQRTQKPQFTPQQSESRRQFLLVPADANLGMTLCNI